MKLSEWLSKNKEIIKINKIEEQAGMPKYTLQKATQGKRPLPKKHESKIKEILYKLRDSINEIKIFNL